MLHSGVCAAMYMAYKTVLILYGDIITLDYKNN